MSEYIVAEVSKAYPAPAGDKSLGQKFEHVINSNLEKGFTLKSFQLSQSCYGEDFCLQTIIAVFQRTHEPMS